MSNCQSGWWMWFNGTCQRVIYISITLELPMKSFSTNRIQQHHYFTSSLFLCIFCTKLYKEIIPTKHLTFLWTLHNYLTNFSHWMQQLTGTSQFIPAPTEAADFWREPTVAKSYCIALAATFNINTEVCRCLKVFHWNYN